MVALILGTLLYVVEGPEHGFNNIPTAVYWAITTITTVGFGDITPRTDFGRFIASVMMLIGWGTLAVPTGIVTAEITVRRHARAPVMPRSCDSCGATGYGPEANFCQQCGTKLPPPSPREEGRGEGSSDCLVTSSAKLRMGGLRRDGYGVRLRRIPCAGRARDPRERTHCAALRSNSFREHETYARLDPRAPRALVAVLGRELTRRRRLGFIRATARPCAALLPPRGAPPVACHHVTATSCAAGTRRE